jgi:hypothetical protein
MTRILRLGSLALAAVACLGFGVPASAQEHPEHPSAAKKIDINALEKAIKEKIAEKAKADGGTFELEDPVLHKTWKLELIKVHRERLSRLEDGRYFACTDMREKGGKDVLDVDFFMKDDGGKLVFSDMSIHKLNGVPRYGWEKQGDHWVKVPAQKKG